MCSFSLDVDGKNVSRKPKPEAHAFNPYPGGSKIFLCTLGNINCCSENVVLIERASADSVYLVSPHFCPARAFPNTNDMPEPMITCLQE